MYALVSPKSLFVMRYFSAIMCGTILTAVKRSARAQYDQICCRQTGNSKAISLERSALDGDRVSVEKFLFVYV